MAGADSWAPAFAKSLLAGQGANATLARLASTFDPATGAISGSSLGPVSIKISPPKIVEKPVAGTTGAMARYSECAVAALDPGLTFVPAPGDRLTFAGVEHTLLQENGVETVYSGNAVAVYKLRWAA